jgi:hypothetical protein
MYPYLDTQCERLIPFNNLALPMHLTQHSMLAAYGKPCKLTLQINCQSSRQRADLHCLSRLLEVAEAQLQEAAAGQLRSTYSNLTNPALTVSLEGFADGKGSAWRHSFGLVGTRTFGEKELQKLALNQQAASTA